jgi:hypothetical protein
MYCRENFKTKKALKEAVAAGREVTIYAPGIGVAPDNGPTTVEGPHFPKPHTWYAQVVVKNGVVVSVK